jgi:peptidoglycan/xylan/chitin deacetylase (PgdA/CDA1 family)
VIGSRPRGTRVAVVLAIAAAALVLFAWIRWERMGGPSPESDLDLPGLFSTARERAALAAAAQPGVPVLCYHYFRPGFNFERLLRVLGAVLLNLPTIPDKEFWSITAPEFERQMRHLRDEGYRTATLDELMLHIAGYRRLPSRTVVLTIDDGDESVGAIAAPILRRYGMHATLFMLTGHAGEQNWNEIDFLTWSQLRELESSGTVQVQSHSHRMHTKRRHRGVATPRFLLECRDERGLVSTDSPLGRDLESSRAAIRRELAHDAEYLSWPFGFGDADTDSLAAGLGFRGIFTLRPLRSVASEDSVETDPRTTIGRFPITARTTFREFRRLVAVYE